MTASLGSAPAVTAAWNTHPGAAAAPPTSELPRARKLVLVVSSWGDSGGILFRARIIFFSLRLLCFCLSSRQQPENFERKKGLSTWEEANGPVSSQKGRGYYGVLVIIAAPMT